MPTTAPPKNQDKGVKVLNDMLYKAVLSTFLFLASFVVSPALAGEISEEAWLCREIQPELEAKRIEQVLDAFMALQDPSGHLRQCTSTNLLNDDQLSVLEEMSLQWWFEMADDPCVVYEFWRNGDEGPAFVRKLRKPKVMPEPEER